ncbi:MAG: hypothetical protein ACLTCJ_09690 [Gemmiger formicilis]|uniref:hypothetical protein n=1 Tax=Gemmiger formicilis TaxID=745368 RepID=UPI003A3180B2
MFGDVSKFAQADYFAAHPSGSLILPDAAYEIELFVCLRQTPTTRRLLWSATPPTLPPCLTRCRLGCAAAGAGCGLAGQADRPVHLRRAETNGRVVLLGPAAPGNFG